LNAVRKWWNNKYPDNQFMTFVINLFTDEFYTVIEKLGILNISINVDSAYWKDARDNLIIDKDQYNQGIGHATTMMKLDDFICVDSIPAGTNLNKPMLYHWGTEEKIDGLNKNGNIRTDAHVIIFNNWLKQPEMDNEEKKRLESMAKSLTNAIQANKEIWELTNDQKEKEERNKQNNRNRAKLKIVESMLK